LNVDDESGADRGEQTGLKCGQYVWSDKAIAETHENQGGVEILIVLLHAFGVVFHCPSLVHGVEIELGSSFLMG